jgi:hypothetical protein
LNPGDSAHGAAQQLTIDTTDELLGAIPAADVATALCVRRNTLATWRRKGVGPPSMRICRQLILYPTERLFEWWASPAATRTRRRALQRSHF